MAEGKGHVAAILWFIAAALAGIAFTIRASRGEMAWALVAACAFFAVMGFVSVARGSRRSDPRTGV